MRIVGAAMNQLNIELPLFPLSIFLLPGGVTRLRIFEPRYLKMLAIASNGFVISNVQNRNGQKTNEQRWGSWVEIINFDKGRDGVLEIDVCCKSLVSFTLNSLETTANNSIEGLQFIIASEIPHWSQKKAATDLGKLTGSLMSLFESHDLLKDLYTDKATENPYWVVARWLELLPIPFEVKDSFVFSNSYVEAKKLVSSII